MSVNFDEGLEFEWDKGNIDKNWTKHKVKNKEAEEVFQDTNIIISEDPKHSTIEERWLVLGKTKKNNKLAIIFTKRGKNIRIISARRMNRKERWLYEKEISTNPKI